MKHTCVKFLIALLVFIVPAVAFAQNTFKVTGKVYDAKTNEPVIGAGVMMKASNIGTVTDLDGNYEITVNDQKGILIVSAVGYESMEMVIGKKAVINFPLEEDVESLEDAVVVGYGTQKKATITGSLTTANITDVAKSTAPTLSNALGGVVPGIITRQSSGEPGNDAAVLQIRGVGTWVDASPLVLVDGIERSLNYINTEEIESFSVLKDASATAVYGMRGANGVILITTKKGKAGRAKVTFRTEATNLHGLRFPEYIKGYEFATLMNEACTVTGVTLPWDDAQIETFKDGSDPYLYPNVNWTDEVLKKDAFQTTNTLSVSGGNETVRYYVSVGYMSTSGLWKEDPTFGYSTNSRAQRYNFRSNVDINLHKNFSITLGLAEIIRENGFPGYGAGEIFYQLKRVSPISYPIRNPDGSFGGATTSYLNVNPYVMVTNGGFIKYTHTSTQATFGAKWDLGDLITPGLQFEGNYSFDHNYNHNVVRRKDPLIKQLTGYDPTTGEGTYNLVREETAMGYSFGMDSNRAYYLDLRLNYNRTFNEHTVGGMLMFNRREYINYAAGTSTAALPYRRQGMAGRLTYNYAQRYLFDVNFGYNGSENFAKGQRYGFFPAASLGWVPTAENWWNVGWINHLKIRGSYGMVGNDSIGSKRFGYISTVNKAANGYLYGISQSWMNGMAEDQIGADNLSWEVARKTDIGLDIELFNRVVRLTADYFHEYRDKILLQRAAMPDIFGAAWEQTPYANIGIMTNEGVDGQIEITNTTRGGFFYSVRANATFAKNTIIEDDTAIPAEPYMNTRGNVAGLPMGYVALGLFQSQEEIDNSPKQELGTYTVGDVKYKDLNDDGFINSNDRTFIGYPRHPLFMYGFGLTLGYKGFDLSLNFTGAGMTSILLDAESMWPFQLDYPAYNVMREYYDNRFIPGAEDNSKAKYPVVHAGTSSNNYQISTLYLRDASYLKLKTAEFGYNFQPNVINKLKIESLRLFLNGNNLLCFDGIKIVDPESNHLGASSYPTQRGVTIGLQVGF